MKRTSKVSRMSKIQCCAMTVATMLGRERSHLCQAISTKQLLSHVHRPFIGSKDADVG